MVNLVKVNVLRPEGPKKQFFSQKFANISELYIIKPTLSNNFNFGLINNQTNVNEFSKKDVITA